MFESFEIIEGGEAAAEASSEPAANEEVHVMGTARIKVFGVGGGGGNAVNNMMEEGLEQVDYVVANTDAQALDRSAAENTLQIGGEITRGLGAGANPEVGYRAAVDSQSEIRQAIGNAEMVFVTAGMGGGTGTGAAPVIARIARDMGALTVGVVTRPFTFEGRARSRRAEQGLKELAEAVDTIIVIPNDRLLELADETTSLQDGFKMADTVLMNAVRGISDIIVTPGLINVDFADVVHIMQSKGLALMGAGIASGQNRAREAALNAINSPLLEDVRIEGATGLLVNITGANTSLREVNEALSMIQDAVHEDTDTIFGAVIDERMGDQLKITVVATGFSRVESNYDDDLRKARNRFATGQTEQVPLVAAPQATPVAAAPIATRSSSTGFTPLSPTSDGTEDQILVAGVSTTEPLFQFADTPQATRAVEEAADHQSHYPVPPPVPESSGFLVADDPVAPLSSQPITGRTEFQSLGVAHTTPRRNPTKPQPVVRNPFTDSDEMHEDLDTPTFMRRSGAYEGLQADDFGSFGNK